MLLDEIVYSERLAEPLNDKFAVISWALGFSVNTIEISIDSDS